MTTVSGSILSSLLVPGAKASYASDSADKSGATGAASFSATLNKAEKASNQKIAQPHTPGEKSSGLDSTPTSGAAGKVDQAGNPKEANPVTAATAEPGTDQSTTMQSPAPTIFVESQAPASSDNAAKPEVLVASSNTGEKGLSTPVGAVEVAKEKIKPDLPDTTPQPIDVVSAVQPAALPLPLPDANQAPLFGVSIAQAQLAPQPPTNDLAEETPLASSIIASINMGKSLDKSSAATVTAPTIPMPPNDKAAVPADMVDAVQSGDTKTVAKAPTELVENSVEKPVENAPVPNKLKPEPEKLASSLPSDPANRVDGLSGAAPTASTTSSQATSNSSNSAPVLQTPVTNQDWAKHLGQQLVNFHLKGDQNVQLHLNPANLGPMSITLNVNEHLQATAHFSSHSSQVRSSLEQGINQLRESMAEQGISLGETSVGEERQQGFAQDKGRQASPFSGTKLAGDTITVENPTPVSSVNTQGSGEISTYV